MWAGLLTNGAGADPMRPLLAPAGASAASDAPIAKGAPAARPPAERLVAIRLDGDRGWQALFGETWLAVGQRYDGLPIIAIDANSVRLAYRGRSAAGRVIYLFPSLLTDTEPPAPGRPSATPER